MKPPREKAPKRASVVPDFRALFESAPGLYLVLTPDLTIAAVSDAYLRATMTERDEIVGRGLFEVFPDNPDDPTATGTRNLRASLDRVRASHVPDAMAIQKYDIRRPDSEGGGFEERFWSPLNSPVTNAAGEIAYIIHRVEDVTEFVRVQRHSTEQERRTRQSEESLRLLVEGVKDYAILMLDPQGRVTTWNSGAERIKGYRAEEILGHHFSGFYPAEDIAAGKPEIALRAAEKEGRYEDEGWRVRKDGSRFWANVVITSLRDESGTHRGFAKITRDITRRKRAEEKFRGLLESAPDAMVIVEPQGRIILVNAQTLKLFGYDREELIGQPVEILVPSRFGNHSQHRADYSADPHVRAMRTGLELSGRRKDGTEFPVEISLGPLQTEEGMLVSSAIRDISERKRSEQILAARTIQLEAANKELESFAYSVSHDLRAPLRSIDGFSRVLQEDFPEKLGPEGDDALRRIRAASQRMGLLIDDLLKLSKVTRAEVRRESVDLSRIAREVARDLQADEPERSVEVAIADGALVEGDPDLLRVALDNLMGNAFKFTSKTDQPRIEFGWSRNGDRPVYFVRDNGAGFDMTYAGKLFGAFQRLHATSDFPGTGIGLATVQRIIHRHGGQVWAEGAVDGGATFSFTI
jgi:PAS domain S-box-containing protein